MLRIPSLALAALIVLPASADPIANAPAGIEAAAVDRFQLDQEAAFPACGDRESVVADLAAQFHEAPLAQGMIDEKALMEMFVSDEGTWTILATGTDGMTCVIAVGEGFQPMPKVIGVGA